MTSTGDMLDIARDAIATAPIEGTQFDRLETQLRIDQAKLEYSNQRGEPQTTLLGENVSELEKNSFWEGVGAAFTHVLNLMARIENEDSKPLALDD